MTRLAIIAGGGALPQAVAAECRKHDDNVFIVALKGYTEKDWLTPYMHKWFQLGQVGHVIATLKKQGVENVIFAGNVRRPSLTKIRPDWQGMKLLWKLRGKKLGDDALLRQLAAFLESHGLKVVGADQIAPDSLMPEGNITVRIPSDEDWKDIDYASKILRVWAEMDQGQAIVVQQGMILGVEGIEGTDELIRRCGQYKRSGRAPILVKMKKPQQDNRLDLPTIGEETIKNVAAAGFAGIAVHAKEAIFLQPMASTTQANSKNIFVVGFDPAANA